LGIGWGWIQQREIEKQLQVARDLYDTGNYPGSVSILKEIIHEDQMERTAYVNLSITYETMGKPDSARIILEDWLKQMPEDSEIKEKYLKIDLEKRLALRDALVHNQKLLENPSEDLLIQPLEIPTIKNAELDQKIVEQMALDEEFILTITENGYGKRSSAYEYRITNRGGSGITNIITSKRNGLVVASFTVESKDQVMIITDKGTLIRTEIGSVRISGRNTQGVTLIKTKDETVVSVARIANTGNKEVDEAETGEDLGIEGSETDSSSTNIA
jgi:tetratricopeptide (TPR) repeat protein